ncbi:MAG: MBL fold metallo-hydrolase [Gemmatimonadota bacterium]|nr:MBL fold metallo-hydrolase [Gemmatimonadota bacterium]
MRIWMLGSGSRGNAVLVECGESRLLIDCGFSPTELARRLEATGTAPECIEALIVTHEHADHARGVAAASRRWGWDVYASTGTVAADASLAEIGVHTFDAGATLSFTHVELRTVRCSHDAAEPVALIATSVASGARAGIAYDLGMMTGNVRDAFTHLDLLVLEANHDDLMLREGPYPIFVQRRIAGRSGHLSNAASAEAARECVHRHLHDVVLAHISEQCNTPVLALKAVGAALTRTRFRGRLTAARQDGVVGPFDVHSSTLRPSTQLAFDI